jgi:multidrug efflux pump subunit AcrA (membrane-fusion protein)
MSVANPQPAKPEDLMLPGTMDALLDTIVGARATGYVRKWYVDIGARVRAGQVLAEIESPDVDQQLYQAQAQTAQSIATVQQAAASIANLKATVSQYRSNVTTAEANLEQSRATLVSTQARLAQLIYARSVAEAQLSSAQHQVGVTLAALKQAQTSRDLAKLTYDRYQTLQKSGFVALQDVDQNRANYENAVAAVDSAQSSVDAANANVEAAQKNVNSAAATVDSGRADVTAAERSVAAMAATVKAQTETVRAGTANVRSGEATMHANEATVRANAANGERYRVLTKFEKVVAPFAGVITARNIDVGSLVSAGTGTSGGGPIAAVVGSASTQTSVPTSGGGGLYGIARTDIMRIFVSVPEPHARQMAPGLPVRIELRELPGRLLHGVVAHASGGMDAVSRTLLTEVHIDNRDGKLLPGMYAQVHFELPCARGALQVPSSALIYDALGTRIATVTRDNKIHLVPVTVGRDYGKTLEITHGLTPNDTFVVSPADDVYEREPLKPTAAPPAFSSESEGRQTGPRASGNRPPRNQGGSGSS